MYGCHNVRCHYIRFHAIVWTIRVYRILAMPSTFSKIAFHLFLDYYQVFFHKHEDYVLFLAWLFLELLVNTCFLLLVLPRHNIMYDVMTFINSGVASPRLTAEMPHMVMTRPVTQENKLELVNKIYSTGR